MSRTGTRRQGRLWGPGLGQPGPHRHPLAAAGKGKCLLCLGGLSPWLRSQKSEERDTAATCREHSPPTARVWTDGVTRLGFSSMPAEDSPSRAWSPQVMNSGTRARILGDPFKKHLCISSDCAVFPACSLCYKLWPAAVSWERTAAHIAGQMAQCSGQAGGP